MDNGMDMLLNKLMPELIGKVKTLEGRVAELEAQKEGIQMFLDQLCPKLVQKIKALEAGATAPAAPKKRRGRPKKEEATVFTPGGGGPEAAPVPTPPEKPQVWTGSGEPGIVPQYPPVTDTPNGQMPPVQITDIPPMSEAPAGFIEEVKAKCPKDSVFTLDDIKRLADDGKTVEKDVQLWYFNGERKTAREFGFADVLDLPFKERLEAFKERGFVTADGSIPSPVYNGGK